MGVHVHNIFLFFPYPFLFFYLHYVGVQPKLAKLNTLINKFLNFFFIIITLSSHYNNISQLNIIQLVEEWSINILLHVCHALQPINLYYNIIF